MVAACRHHTSTVVCDSTVSLVLSRAVGAMGGVGVLAGESGRTAAVRRKRGWLLARREHGRSGLVQVPEAHASGWALWGGRFLPVKQRCRGESTASVRGTEVLLLYRRRHSSLLSSLCAACLRLAADVLPFDLPQAPVDRTPQLWQGRNERSAPSSSDQTSY